MPEEIAIGPAIPLWCDPELLERLDGLGSTHPDRTEAMVKVMLCARRNWSVAVGVWAEDAGVTAFEARRMIVSRRPYCP